MPKGVYIRTERTAEHCRNISKAKLGKKLGPPSPEAIKKLREAATTPEALERSRMISASRTHTPEDIEKMMGDNNPAWQGGISFEPYSPEFNEALKRRTREQDGNVCQYPECNKTEEENGRKLDVHHIDYNKQNCADDNLITLCNGCNSRVNANRDYWTKFFQEKLELKMVA